MQNVKQIPTEVKPARSIFPIWKCAIICGMYLSPPIVCIFSLLVRLRRQAAVHRISDSPCRKYDSNKCDDSRKAHRSH